MVSLRHLLTALLTLTILFSIVFLAVIIRSSTLKAPTVLDYDPWWFYRHAKEIVENHYKIPKWDLLSYYPPGRPYSIYQGWPFTIALTYKVMNYFTNISLMQVAKLMPLIMVASASILAFLLGRLVSNNIAGLFTTLFLVVSPTFIGVSMAGYVDSDVVVVFYTFLSVLTILTAVKYSKYRLRSIPLYLLAAIAVLLFAFNWSAGWLPLILFAAFIPALIIFRIIEEILHQRKLKINFRNLLPDLKAIIIPLLIIFLITNILGHFLLHRTMVQSFLGGLRFTGIGGEPLIVNISVAELQTINIFTKAGFLTVADRAGILPTILTFVGLPLLVLYKFYKREKINFIEIFLFLWTVVSFYLILKGVRFALLFSTSSSLSAGYVIGNLFNYLRNKHLLIFSTVFAIIGMLTFIAVSDAIQMGQASSGLAISQNWYDALDWLKANADKNSMVATWWDPGHIIAGYTGLKSHADGAHCWYGDCIPYDHNIRIRDMGRLMSTNNETESIQLIKKYTHITEEQCNQARKVYGDKMPVDACKDVPEVYVMATNDLIGKYYWMSCFGTFDMTLWDSTSGKQWKCDGRNFIQIGFSNFDKQGLPIYAQGSLTVTLLQNGTNLLAVVNSPGQRVRNALVSDVVFYQNGERFHSKTETNNTLDGMIWIDPSFRTIIFMDPKVRDSIFTRMFFFDGEGLQKFDMMYQNPEVKIFKAKLD